MAMSFEKSGQLSFAANFIGPSDFSGLALPAKNPFSLRPAPIKASQIAIRFSLGCISYLSHVCSEM